MPYILISTQIRLESGPTIVGDEKSDPELMAYLGAEMQKPLGQNYPDYRTADPPRLVLDKLDQRGYRLVSACGIGQTVIWTLYKADGTS